MLDDFYDSHNQKKKKKNPLRIMFFHVILMFFSSVSFPCGFLVSGCDEHCADKPVFTPSKLVVKYGNSASANCSVCQHACQNDIFGMETPVGDTTKHGTTISWTVDRLTEWGIIPMCFYNEKASGKQCCSRLPVTVYKPPDTVSISFVHQSMLEGHQSTLQCTVQDVAPIDKLVVTFYKEQTALTQLRDKDLKEQKPVNKIFTLNITTSREDNGCQYWCEAKLDLGPEGPQLPPVVKSDSIIATVFYKPHIERTSHTDPITITEGSDLQLKCSAVGNPSPSYTWTFPSARIPPSNDSDISIKSVTSADEGEYTCSVSNKLGTVTMKFTVIVKGLELTSTSLPPTTTTISTTTTTEWNRASCGLINWFIICFMLLFSALI